VGKILTIQSCVIGLSKVGLIHCSSLKKIKKTSLAYVYDKNNNLSNKIARKFKCKTSIDFNKILKKKNIKLFVISSPTKTHEYYIRKLIKHKKMIYCEKPILDNNKKLDQIIKLIKKNKIKFCVGLNRRFSKEYMIIKKKIKRKRPSMIHIISRSDNHNLDLSLRNGGLFFDKGFHFFDLACWLGSSTPKKMIVISKSISSDYFLKKGDFSDAIINLKLKNGTIVELVFSRMSRMGTIEKINIYGKNFSLNSDNYVDKKNLHTDFSIRHKNSYFECLKRFVDFEKTFLLNEGILTQKICSKALKLASAH
tara:strand:- start:872 stop:1798 length:927 start_codon:yes stop_codon:yes gene_type:complete